MENSSSCNDAWNISSFSFDDDEKDQSLKMEEEEQVHSMEAIKLPPCAFRSPMRSLSFEDNIDFVIDEFKPINKPQSKAFPEDTLLDTNENNANPDIPTISCHTVNIILLKYSF